jgi:hypothetical protein
MAIIGSKDTQKRLKAISQAPAPDYDFRISADHKYIWIKTAAGLKPYSVSILEFMERNPGLDEATRDMARRALEKFGKGYEPKESEIYGETVTIILGTKVYKDIRGTRFFAWIKGKPVYKTKLTELEKAIKGA